MGGCGGCGKSRAKLRAKLANNTNQSEEAKISKTPRQIKIEARHARIKARSERIARRNARKR